MGFSPIVLQQGPEERAGFFTTTGHILASFFDAEKDQKIPDKYYRVFHPLGL
jgi:hypothetical protein